MLIQFERNLLIVEDSCRKRAKKWLKLFFFPGAPFLVRFARLAYRISFHRRVTWLDKRSTSESAGFLTYRFTLAENCDMKIRILSYSTLLFWLLLSMLSLNLLLHLWKESQEIEELPTGEEIFNSFQPCWA